MRKVKFFILFFICFSSICSFAQTKKINDNKKSEKYITLNPLGFVEPQMAIGLGFENRFAERSSYFTEISFITRNPIELLVGNNKSGFRFIGQYRYHFLNLISRKNIESFASLEFRLKRVKLIGATGTFVNSSTKDTINTRFDNADVTQVGGTLIWGGNTQISDKIILETTIGVGLKQRIVNFSGVPNGYKYLNTKKQGIGFGLPSSYKVGTIVFPQFSIRLKYLL